MSRKGNIALIPLIIIILIVAGAVFFLVSQGIVKNPLQNLKGPSLGGQIFKKSQNPLQGKMPEVDVFQAKTNPFKDIYPNPFGRTSK